MNTKVLIADPIVLNNRNHETYTSTRKPQQIVEQMGGIFVEGPIPDGATYPEGKTVYSYQPNLTPEQITAAVGDGQFNGIIVAAKAVKPKDGMEQVDGKPFLQFAVRIGAGTNNVEEVGKAGGVVMNTPGFNSRPTAEAIVYALNQVISPDARAALNRASPTDLSVQTSDVLGENPRASSNDLSAYYHGGWPAFEGTKPAPLRIAIIGAGHIGGEVEARLRADGHNVVTYSRSNTQHAANAMEAARGADVIIVQTPLTDGTRGIISEEVIRAANRGVIIVNAARSEVVDFGALKKAVLDGQVGGLIADLDYLPDRDNSPMQPYIDIAREAMRQGLFSNDDKRIILSPHTFADTHSPSREAGAMQAIESMQHALQNPDGPFMNHVNRGDHPTLVRDGLKLNSLSPHVAGAARGLSDSRDAGAEYQFGIAGRPLC